jgi:hypothetical protein
VLKTPPPPPPPPKGRTTYGANKKDNTSNVHKKMLIFLPDSAVYTPGDIISKH